MHTKTLLSLSLLSIAALTSACSRHKVAGTPNPTTTASADRAAMEAASRETAALHADGGDPTTDATNRIGRRPGDQAAITAPVYFEFDRAEISEDGLRALDQKVDALHRNPNVNLRIEGNADDSGSDEYNVALSQRRAEIVSRYFTDRGIEPSRIKAVAYGEERPACTVNREEDCRSKNRRDEFVITSGF